MSTTTLTRSTNAITEFVQAARKAALLAKQLKTVQDKMQELNDTVLTQIGDSRTTTVDGVIVTLTPRVIESVKRVCDDETAVAFFRTHGLPVNTRSPEYIAPAAFTSQVKKGAVSPDLYTIEKTVSVNVI